ncbi:E3 ubiquitin-protein ligase RAD18 isoform X5 [Pristis pectinata]|uniref:E3 ubiquitin-protein ligase RAD18 isoform X5 n=1 Tax=Pristis pectinata TaxID=685728 RepID=UPI00223E053B|nr:E3 ubiquitin-protein ligase RAD18 isoform X5 [Pristis pectinata]
MVPCRRMQSVNDARCLVWQMRPVKVAPTLQRRTQPSMDEILRCGICFEYFNIAMMIPHCSHNYCSLCVRKFLSYKTQCPICCVTVTEPELLNNRVLDELVKCFRTARELLSKCDLQSPPVSPQAAQAADISNRNQSSGFKAHAKMKREMKYMDRFLSQSHSSIRPSGVQSTEKQCEEEQSDTYTQSITANCLADLAQKDNDAEPSTSGLKEIVKVDCPVCAVAIPEKNINRHLDSCLTQEDKKESLRSSVNKRKLLPKLVYNLLSDRDLKKKLKECGLSTQGSKAQLVKRHQEFIQMYNSQCDSLNPKSGEKHKEQFQQLITEVRNRWKSKGKKLKSEHDKETEEQCLTIREVDITECQNMDCNTEEACQDEPQLPEITGSLVTSDTLKPESCSFDVVLPSSLSTSSSDSDICRDPEYSQEPEESTDMQLSKVSTGKRKMREPFRKRSSENKRARM